LANYILDEIKGQLIDQQKPKHLNCWNCPNHNKCSKIKRYCPTFNLSTEDFSKKYIEVEIG
jgi:hypothetical protein